MNPMEEIDFFGSQPTRSAGGVEHTKKLLSFNQAQSKINKEINKLAHPGKPTPPVVGDSIRQTTLKDPKPPPVMVNPPSDLASMLNKRMLAPPMQSYQKERQQSRERQRLRQQRAAFPQPPSMCPDTTDNLMIRERQLQLPTVEQSMLTQTSVQQVTSFDEALLYLQEAVSNRTGAVGAKASFLHVTPRYNVDPTVIKKNFYELAILDKPGSANSGLVWARVGVNYHSNVSLGKYDLMQLSAKGLLYSELDSLGDGTISTFQPVADFIAERKLYEKVNRLKFFGFFRELKYFTAWKLSHRSKKVKRASLYLQQHSWFSHSVFIEVYLFIINACYDLEQTVEVCYFNPNGGNLNAMEYVTRQMERIRTVIMPLCTKKVNAIIAFIHRNYSETTSAEHLMSVLAADGIVPKVKKPVPVRGDCSADVESEQEFDLMFRRELEFLKQQVFKRMQYLVQLFQHRLNTAVANIMLCYWVRFTELLRGIRTVSVNSSKPVGYWDSNRLDYEVYAYHHHHHHHVHAYTPQQRHHHAHHEHHAGVHYYHKYSHDTKSSNYQQYLLYSSFDLDRKLIEISPGSNINHRFVVQRAVSQGEADESHENTDGHFNFSVQGPVNVTKLYEGEGVHLSVDIIMSDSSVNMHADLEEPRGDSRGAAVDHHVADIFKSVLDVCKMKAVLFPSRTQLMKSMDELLSCLHHFLEGIPNALHTLLPLMARGDEDDEDADGADFEFEDEEKINQVRIDNATQGVATAESSPYFKWLLQVYSLRHSDLVEITVANLKALRDAYRELSSLERRQSQLHDTYKRLLSLHPTVLATQLNTSLALPKVRTMIELSPSEVDDLQRCEDRDIGRLEALTHALEFLELSKQKVGHWCNMKHHRGIVSSFYYCNEQINRFRDLQMTDLYATLPHAFIKRIKLVLGFMQQMDRVFDLSGADLNGIIAMLTKLKNFDTARNGFDREMEIIKSLHNILHNHLCHCHVTSEAAHQEALMSSYVGQVVGNQKGVISFDAAHVDHVFTARAYTTSDMLFKQCMNMYNTMMSNISKCRLLLGSQLPQIKKEILVDCELLRGTITKCTDLLQEFNGMTVRKDRGFSSNDSGPDPTFKNCSQLRTLGPEIDKAKVQAQRLVVMQTMLAEAHDIVGLGSEFFSKKDIDCFDSMNKVSTEYRLHSVAWESVLEAKTIQRKLMASKLGSCDCVVYQHRVVNLQYACESILRQQKHLLMVDESIAEAQAVEGRRSHAPVGKKPKDTSSAVQDTLIASQMLTDIIALLSPRLECTIYLSFTGLQYHHWKEISDEIFSLCKLNLTIPVDSKEPVPGVTVPKTLENQQSEMVSAADIMGTVLVQDVSNKSRAMEIGSLGETPVATIVRRGISKYNNGIREILAESVVEFLIGQVLGQTEKTLQSATFKFSADWVRLGQRAGGMENFRITNMVQLRVMLQYCSKSVSILEDTSSDMGLSLFSGRLYKLMGVLRKMNSFADDMSIIQHQYQYVRRFLKTAFRGADNMTELDLDTVRLYSTITDDLKSLESMLSSGKDQNFHRAFNSMGSRGVTAAENLRAILGTGVETIHSNVQSAYDAFPRLSLLSYTSLNALMALWVLDPTEQLDVLNSSIQQMMEGVGSLIIHKDISKRKMFCRGFVSHDKTEKVVFPEPILMSIALPDFLVAFELSLQSLIVEGCDVAFTARTQALRSLVQQVVTDEILECLGEVFKQRWSQLALCLSVERPNQCFVLSNQCKFAEDIWLCLGHLGGAYFSSMAHANMEAFKPAWKKSLNCLLEICTVNLDHFRNFLDPTYRLNTMQAIHDTLSAGNIGSSDGRMSTQQRQMRANQSGPTILNSTKEYSLYSSLFLQELSNVDVIKELLGCASLDVAVDLWASRYQLRFIQEKSDRVKCSPFDITIGCSTVTHRMEYRGGYIKPCNHVRLEHVLHHVISSASYNKGSVFILHDTTGGEAEAPSVVGGTLFDAKEEYAVSAQDVAHALGRILCPISSITSMQCARLFLSRLVFLDAVGCVDFTSIDFEGLQLLSNAMNSMVSSLDKKDEYYLQESLKYPLKGRVTRNDYHTYRRNACVHALRDYRLKMTAGNCFKNMIVIGMGSDSIFSDLAVFEHFSRGLFSSISVNNNQPCVTSLKVMLSVKGYQFAGELHSSMMQSIRNCLDYATSLLDKPGNEAASKIIIGDICKKLVSSRVLCKIVSVSGELLVTTLMSAAFRTKQLRVGQLVTDYLTLAMKPQAGGRSGAPSKEAISNFFDLHLRFQTEVLCFTAVLWENVLVLLLQAGHRFPSVPAAPDRPIRKVDNPVDIPVLKQRLCQAFQDSLDSLPVVPGDDLSSPAGMHIVASMKVTIVRAIGASEVSIPSKMQTIIESICAAEDVSADPAFVFQCVALWTMIFQTPLSAQGTLIGVSGAGGSGKTTVREIVLRALSKISVRSYFLLSQTCFCSSVVQKPLQAARIIVRAIVTYRKSIKLRRLLQTYQQQSLIMYTSAELKSRENCLHPRFKETVVRATLGTDNVLNSTGNSFGVFSVRQRKGNDMANVVHKALRGKNENVKFGGADIRNAAGDVPKTIHEAQLVESSTIFHNSLTLETLVGTYDKDGMWKDGLLVRKIRAIEQSRSAVVQSPEQTNALHTIVLDGVMGPHLEHVFLSSAYQHHNSLFSCAGGTHATRQTLNFPCGEMSRVPSNTIIIIESADSSHASPVLLSIIPQLHISVTPETHIKRVLRVWIRNVSHCVRRFSPWAGVVDELCVMLQSELVTSLILSDMATGTSGDGNSEDGLVNTNIAMITSQLSTFLRILEDLLQECHELALADGTHVEEVADDDDSSDDSDSSSDSDSDSDSDNGSQDSNSSGEEASTASVDLGEFSSFITSVDNVGGENSDMKEEVKTLPKKSIPGGRLGKAPAMVFVLGTSGRENLMMRVKMSVMYAAIWGFGGIFNSTTRRKFFENLARRTFDEYVSDPLGDHCVSLPFDCSIFDLYLCLPQLSFIPALYKRSDQGDINAKSGVSNASAHLHAVDTSIPKDLHRSKVDIEVKLAQSMDSAVPSKVMDIIYLSSSQNAVSNVMRSIVRSGGNALLLGGHNAGKSFIINALLAELRKNCASPANMRRDIVANLRNLVCNHNAGVLGKGVPASSVDDGSIPNTLKGVRNVLNGVERHFKNGSYVSDDITTHSDHWTDVNSLSEDSDISIACGKSKNARYHFSRQSIYSASVSLSSVHSSDKMRHWLKREFKGEVEDTLESPRHSHGIVFVDDMHLAPLQEAQSSREAASEGLVSNRVEGLLKGLLAVTPLFGTMRMAGDFMERHSVNGKAKSYIPENSLLMHQAVKMPTMHAPRVSDPRQFSLADQSPTLMDNSMIQPLGFITAATGDFDAFVSMTNESKSLLCSTLPYMCTLSLPTANFVDIHAALIVSSFACMRQGNLKEVISDELAGTKSTLIDTLKLNIVELCNFTISIWSGMFKIIEVPVGAAQSATISATERSQHMAFSAVERSITAASVPTLTAVSKFSKYLSSGSHSITSKADLLPLWLHEWHRLFLDPYPVECQQRQRVVGLIQTQLDGLDLDAWGLQSDHIRSLTGKLQGIHSNIWLSTNVFDRGIIPAVGSSYRQIELDLAETDKNIQAGTWFAEEEAFSKHGRSTNAAIVPLNEVPESSSMNLNVILYPQAITLMLRIIRVLKSSHDCTAPTDDEAGISSAHSECTNLVLMGFPGGTRKTVVEMATKVCNIPLMAFEVKENMGVINEHNSSERLRNFCFKEFLKEVVWKAVGFSCICPQNSTAEHEMRVHIESVPPQKVCMLISGVPMLSNDDKCMLVNLLAGTSIPVDLFNDTEFGEMIECLRQSLRERNIEAAMALHALNHEAAARAQAELQSEGAEGTSTARRLSDALGSPHVAPETFSSLQPGMQPPGGKEMKGGLSANAASYLPPLSSQAPTHDSTITGYSYHWLKKYLCTRLKTYLSVILDADISRSYLVEPSIDVNGGRAGFNNDPAPTNAQSANNAASAAGPASSGIGGGGGRRQSRFSMVSTAAVPRRLSMLAGQPTASEISAARGPSAVGNTARRPSVLPPRKDSASNRRRSTVISVGGNVVRLSADGTAIASNKASISTAPINAGRNVLFDHSAMVNRDYLSFVCCPILGPLISSAQYDIIWHDVDGYDAATGVCNVLMRNVRLSAPNGDSARSNYSGRTSPTGLRNLKPAAMIVNQSPNQQLTARTESCRIALKPILSANPQLGSPDSSFDVDVTTTIVGPTHSTYSALFPHVSWFSSVGIFGSLTLLKRDWLMKQALEAKANNINIVGPGSLYPVGSPKKTMPASPASARKLTVPILSPGPPSPVQAVERLGPLGHMPADVLECTVAAMKEEARSILPHLLTLKIPGIDNMLVTKPLLCLDMEHLAMIASEMVMVLLHDGAAVILQRQHTLSIALTALRDSLQMLENAKSIQKTLATNNVQIVKATRKATAAVSSIQKTIEEFPVKSLEHESHLTMQKVKVEIASADELVQNMQDAAEKYVAKFKGILKAFSPEQLAEFSTMQCGSKTAAADSTNTSPSRYVIMLMRAVMLLLNFAVVEKPTGKKKEKDKDKDTTPQIIVSAIDPSLPNTHDDTIVKYSAQLASSGEFVQRLCAILPSAVERAGQLESLKYANAVLHTALPGETPPSTSAGSRLFTDNLAEYEAPSIMSIASREESTVPEENMDGVYCCLRDYLQAIEVYCLTQTEIAQTRQRIADLRSEYAAAEERYRQYFSSGEHEMKEALVDAKETLHSVDEVGLDNKIKMDQLRRMLEDKERLSEQCNSCLTYVENELTEIDAVLVCLVGDTCVAAAVFARASCHKEQIRQECMDAYRADLRLRLGPQRVSDSPYLLGCMVDRLQIRHWTNGHFESLPRDPATINAASLLYLSPMFTYIFDPEQVCEHAIADLLPIQQLESVKSEYDVYSTTAQNFTLAHLESWIDSAMVSNQSMDIAVAIVITEVQTGGSDDLVNFLSASMALSASDEGPKLGKEHVDYCGLNRKGRERPCVSIDMSNGVDGRAYSFTSSRSAKLLLTNKLRVILFATTLPTMDPLTNTCSPLPLCCFKHMSVLHWSASCSNVADWHSENKPFFSHAMSNTHTSDFVLETKMVETLCAKLAPDLYSQLYVYNKMVIETTNELYQLENSLVYALENWHMQEETTKQADGGLAQQNSELQTKLGYSLVSVPFGFLVDSRCVRVLDDCCAAKRQLQVEVETWKSFEREIYSYQSTVGGLFAMSVDFVRMVSVIVPSYHLTPYCLSAKNICTKGIAPLIHKAIPVRQSDPVESVPTKSLKSRAAAGSTENERNLLFVMQKIPPSLISMSKLNRAVIKLQNSFRVKTGRPLPAGRTAGSMKVQQEASAALMNIKLARVLSAKTHTAFSPTSDIKSRFLVRFGFDEFSRKQLMLDLNVLLLPLKLPLFYSVVEYLLSNIIPGYEYLVKFCVLLTTLMQPHSNGGSSSENRGLPLEEVRALVEIWRGNNAGIYNSDRLYYCNFYRIRKSVRKNDLSSQRGALIGAGSSARKARSRSNSGNGDLTDENEDEFVPAYRPQFARSSTMNSGAAAGGCFKTLAQASWRSIGPGRLDGVWISRKSTKWRIKSVPENAAGLIMESELNPGRVCKAKKADGFVTVHSDVISCDMLAPDLLVKNRNTTPRPYDLFMAEWLEILHEVKACSVHSFSSQSITSFARKGAAGGGALDDGNIVLEEIGLRNLHQELQRRRARVSTMFPVNKLIDNARSSINFEAHPPVQIGIPHRPSIIKPGAFKPKKKDAIDEESDSDFDDESNKSEDSQDRARRVQEKLAELKRSKVKAAKTKSDISSLSTRSTRSSILSTSGLAPTDPRRQSILKVPPPSRRDSLLKAPVVQVSTSRISMMMNGVGATSGRRLSSLSGSSSIANGNTRMSMLNSTMKGGVQEDLDEEILPPAPHFRQLCAVMENHHSLGRIFAGLTSVIFVKYDDEILEWKRALMETSSLDVQALSPEELHELVMQLIPPIIDERDDADMSSSTVCSEGSDDTSPQSAPEKGLWMMGKELSILQTIILASVLTPCSVGKLIEIYLAMVTVFLQKDGILVGHSDELNITQDDNASEDEMAESSDDGGSSDDDDDEKGDGFRKGVVPAHSLSTGGNGPSKRKHQDDIMVINSWSKLSNIVGGLTTPRQARYSGKTSRFKLTCREYENWECVLLDILTCFPTTPVDKYTYMRTLRDAVSGVSTNVFLSSPTARSALGGKSDDTGGNAQLILLSQRAKELSQYSNKHVPLFNSKLYEGSDGTATDVTKLTGFIDSVKRATLSNVQQRAIIQNISLHSSAGNTIFAAILTAVHASTGSLSSIGTGAGAGNKGIGAKPVKDAHKDIAENIEKALARKEVTRNVIAKSYPLIISSHWQEEHNRSSFSYQASNTVDARSRYLKQYNMLSNGPFCLLGTMNYSWLPRFRCVDIISTVDSNYESAPEHRLSINESCGALYEELEGSLIWAINSFRLLTKTNLTSRIKNRFKFANKLESRLTSALIAIYRLCMYVECKEREEEKSAAVDEDSETSVSSSVEWSKCVEPVSLWQLSRLMLHATEIVNDAEKFADGDNPASVDVLANTDFRHGVALCSSTFLEFLAGHVGLEEPARKRTSSKGRTSGSKKKKSVDGGNAAALKAKSAPPQTTGQSQAPLRRASTRVVSAMAAPMSPSKSNPRPPDSAFKPSGTLAAARPSLVPSSPPGTREGKCRKTVAGIISQNISALAQMRHVDSLRPTDTELRTTDAGLTIRNPLRLHSMVGLFLAEITQKVISDGIDKDARQSFLHGQKQSKYSRHSMTTTEYNRHSIAAGVATGREDRCDPNDGRDVRRETISMEHCNITVGGLSELETLHCIVRWTLDGMYNSNDTPTVATTTDTSTSSTANAAAYVAPRMTKQRRKYILGVLRKYILKQGNPSGASAVATMMSNIVQDQGNARVLQT